MKALTKVIFLLFAMVVVSHYGASAQQALLNTTNGCPFNDGVSYARCHKCWTNCSGYTGIPKCSGDCVTNCGVCFRVWEIDFDTDQIDIYYPNGTIKVSHFIDKGWAISDYSFGNGDDGVQIMFVIQ